MMRLVFVPVLFAALSVDAQAKDAESPRPTIAVNARAPLATLQAAGAQIYVCAKTAAGGLSWTFREPVATLLEGGKTVGRDFAGPTWEFIDGSHVAGKVTSKVPGKTAQDIPWLKLSVDEPPESGLVAGATSILRSDTKGGNFEGSCENEGELHSQPYTATYTFMK